MPRVLDTHMAAVSWVLLQVALILCGLAQPSWASTFSFFPNYPPPPPILGSLSEHIFWGRSTGALCWLQGMTHSRLSQASCGAAALCPAAAPVLHRRCGVEEHWGEEWGKSKGTKGDMQKKCLILGTNTSLLVFHHSSQSSFYTNAQLFVWPQGDLEKGGFHTK